MSASLSQEREKLSFNVKDLSYYIYNGKERYEKIIEAYKILAEDPILRNDMSMLGMSRIDQVKIMAEKTKRSHEVFNLTESNPHNLIEFWSHNITQLHLSVSFFMFIPYIKTLGTPEQVEKWVKPALRTEVIGAYAQTELGHGSDVQNLETTATFDPKTDEFIINSPTLTSINGGLGN